MLQLSSQPKTIRTCTDATITKPIASESAKLKILLLSTAKPRGLTTQLSGGLDTDRDHGMSDKIIQNYRTRSA